MKDNVEEAPSTFNKITQGLYNYFTSSEQSPTQLDNSPEDDMWDEVTKDISPAVNPMIGGIMKAHSKRMGTDYDESTENALRFSTFVGLIENSGQTYGANIPEEGVEQTNAQGLYQFIDDDDKGQSSWQTGLNRAKKYLGPQDWISESYEYGKGGVNLATRNQQTAVFLADLLEQKGSDDYMRPILEGDTDGWVDTYLKLHYKGTPTPATIKRAEEVYKLMNINVRF